MTYLVRRKADGLYLAHFQGKASRWVKSRFEARAYARRQDAIKARTLLRMLGTVVEVEEFEG